MPETSADYLAKSDALEAQGRAAIEAGDTARGLALLDQAAEALGVAVALRRLEEMRERLTTGNQPSTVGEMSTATASGSLSRSKSRRGKRDPSADFMRALWAAGYASLRHFEKEAGEKIGVSQSMISQVMNGTKKLSEEKQALVEKLIGMRVPSKNKG